MKSLAGQGVSLSQEYVGSNLKEIEKNGLLFILISLIAGSVFAMFVAGRLSKGLQKLVSAAKKIKDGNREIRVGTSKSFEIAELETAFNQMLDDISSKEKLLSMVLENMPIGVFYFG
ncbi:MAG: HAMP domain-containing protein [Ferruginibacter sp.]